MFAFWLLGCFSWRPEHIQNTQIIIIGPTDAENAEGTKGSYFEWLFSLRATVCPILYAEACIYHPPCEIHQVIFMVIGSMVNQALQQTLKVFFGSRGVHQTWWVLHPGFSSGAIGYWAIPS